MTKRHDDVFDAVLSGVQTPRDEDKKPRGGARFLKRGNAISDRVSGQQEEKIFLWVDPEDCRMWDRHNRDYALLNEESCRDLIEGIRSQGRQEFPAVVRKCESGPELYEVICGARRHFSVAWLRANNYPQFRFLIEVRDISDEEAFRLADIENRDREDISDYERAVDYAGAIDLYYGGRQKAMAERLEVSEVWLSRYLELARLPSEVVAAYPTKRDIRELHARTLKPLLKVPTQRKSIVAKAEEIAAEQERARGGQGALLDAAKVLAALKVAAQPPKAPAKRARLFGDAGVSHTVHGAKHRLEFSAKASREDLEDSFGAFLDARFS